MNSCTIASIGAYERDSGLYNLCEQNIGSDRAGILRPLTTNNPEAIIKMSKRPNKFFSQKSVKIDTTPISATLRSLPTLSLKLVSRSDLEPLWDHLVSTYHYLGYRRLLGHRLKYLVFTHDRPLAALSWSAPALKLRVRDTFIGWSDEQRKEYLNRIANNSRFLILPWVRVPHLASHIPLLTPVISKEQAIKRQTGLFSATPMALPNKDKDISTTVLSRRSMYMY